MNGFEKLEVYQKSYKLVLEIYRRTKGFSKEETYGLTNQIRRASWSIPLNIAEGYAKRESQSEFRRFLMMAFGSNAEMEVLLKLSEDLGYMSETESEELKRGYEEVGRMLNILIQRIGERI